jgi:hypothetical protein
MQLGEKVATLRGESRQSVKHVGERRQMIF